jgi:hypothetical protein
VIAARLIGEQAEKNKRQLCDVGDLPLTLPRPCLRSIAYIYSRRKKIEEANCPENGVSKSRELVLMIGDQRDEIDSKLD